MIPLLDIHRIPEQWEPEVAEAESNESNRGSYESNRGSYESNRGSYE